MNRAELVDIIKSIAEEEVRGALARRLGDTRDTQRAMLFVEAMMKREEDRRQFWRDIRRSAIGWLIITAIGGIGLMVYQGVVDQVADVIRHGK